MSKCKINKYCDDDDDILFQNINFDKYIVPKSEVINIDNSDSEDEKMLFPEDNFDSDDDNGYNFEKLKIVIISKSVAKFWDQAKTEWELEFIYEEPDGECVCGHKPIMDHCVIRNKHIPENTLVVGNRCVQRFKGEIAEYSQKLFDCIKKWNKQEDADKRRANVEMIKLFHKRKILSDNDKEFYLENYTKRTSLSDRQLEWMMNLNEKILNALDAPPKICNDCSSIVYQQISKNDKKYYLCKNHVNAKFL
jgi:hypothetical protein